MVSGSFQRDIRWGGGGHAISEASPSQHYSSKSGLSEPGHSGDQMINLPFGMPAVDSQGQAKKGHLRKISFSYDPRCFVS